MNYRLSAVSVLATLFLLGCQESASPQSVERNFNESSFTGSNLPVAVIQATAENIPDEPKILTTLTLINNPDGNNAPGQTGNLDYGHDEEHRYAGIEVRGFGSQLFAKQQYGLELWTADNGADLRNYPIGTTEESLDEDDVLDDQEAELLGMSEEEDWILYAPYSDKSLMRNVIAYDLAANITGQWQPATEYIELFFRDDNDQLDYRGIYVLTERIKRDSNRVDINKLKDDEIEGEDLTGGYILELTPANRVKADEISFRAGNGTLLIEYPKKKNIQPEQIEYITEYVNQFVSALYSDHAEDDETGYAVYADFDSLVDYFLIHELFKNRDGFHASTYFHKDKNGKLIAGPVWDFNLSSGNDTHADNTNTSPRGWFYQKLWVAERLYQSPSFVQAYKQRWKDLRTGLLADEALSSRIADAFNKLNQGAAERNFEKWDILGKFIQGNQIPDSRSHREEVEYFREWLLQRMHWIDTHIDTL